MVDDIFFSSDSVRSGRALRYAHRWTLPSPLVLRNGEILPEVTVFYETYGTLNADQSNAVCVCHALSGDSHVASHDETDDPGWWELMVGPNKPIDTNQYFVVCANILGGCRGTTGPDSINPQTGERYGADFPSVEISDIVEVQRQLISTHLGIKRLRGIVGGSLGGFVAMDWATRFPESLLGVAALATCAHVSSQALAFDIVARNAILSDPHFHGGQYYDKETSPSRGLAMARMLGHITYLSRESMTRKFDTNRTDARRIDSSFETNFSVGSYLAHQGDKFVERFDANSYITISRAIDRFNLGESPESLVDVFAKSQCRWLFISFTSDWLFPAYQSQELATAAIQSDRRVSYCNIKSDCGHDAFFLDNDLPMYGGLVASFLRNLDSDPSAMSKEDVSPPIPTVTATATVKATATAPVRDTPKHRIDYDRILELIPPGKKILDLGCGRGDLLLHLTQRKMAQAVGLELDEKSVLRCVERNLDVIHADLDLGLGCFRDRQFDYVILSKTLQTVRNVELVLQEMLRVGDEAVVSFPNFGYHRFRTELEMFGTAPQTDTRPGKKWFNTNDVRFLTIADFEEFCEEKHYKIRQLVALDTERGIEVTEGMNVEADVAIAVLSFYSSPPLPTEVLRAAHSASVGRGR